ncbi:MAG: hypothetical protein ABFD83_02570 [Armatimonadota bacterium]
MRLISTIVFIAVLLAAIMCGACASDWATSVAEGLTFNLDPNVPYNDAGAALGRPTTLIQDAGYWPIAPGSVFHASMVYAPYNLSPDGQPLVATVLAGGQITVEFDPPIYDDPENWDGKDLIVFGNSMFTSIGTVFPATNMEEMNISSDGQWEQATVSVSQYENGDWYTFASPYADDFAPTQASAWDWIENNWADDLDYTKPVPTDCTKADFGEKSVAQGIDMYKGSAGGTALDISSLPLPTDESGRKWIRYVKITGDSVELDAVTRVSHKISPISVGAAKELPDAAHVILKDVVISAGTYAVGRFCYAQDSTTLAGIRVYGRVLDTGSRVTIYGNMTTVNGERAINAVAIDPPQGADQMPSGNVKVVGMSNRSITSGLGATGMPVKTWGTVEEIDDVSKSFIIDDGSGVDLKCMAPRVRPASSDPANPTNPDWGTVVDPEFTPPSRDSFVLVTGIISSETSGQDSVPILQLRSVDDLDVIRSGAQAN